MLLQFRPAFINITSFLVHIAATAGVSIAHTPKKTQHHNPDTALPPLQTYIHHHRETAGRDGVLLGSFRSLHLYLHPPACQLHINHKPGPGRWWYTIHIHPTRTPIPTPSQRQQHLGSRQNPRPSLDLIRPGVLGTA